MKLIVEGPDGSGKTTLANHLACELSLPIHKSEGPVGDSDDFLHRYWSWREWNNIIHDRHALVSEPIYGPIMQRRSLTESDIRTLDHFYNQCPMIIFCAGSRSLDRHVADSRRDTPEYLSMLAKKHADIVRTYDRWADDRLTPRLYRYRIGDSLSKVVSWVRENATMELV